MGFYLRRLAALALIALAIWGYSLWTTKRAAEEVRQQELYAETVAHLGLVRALNKNSDSLSDPARDSVLETYQLSQDKLTDYLNSFEGREQGLTEFWKTVKEITDSLVAIELEKIELLRQSATDTVVSDTMNSDTMEAATTDIEDADTNNLEEMDTSVSPDN